MAIREEAITKVVKYIVRTDEGITFTATDNDERWITVEGYKIFEINNRGDYVKAVAYLKSLLPDDVRQRLERYGSFDRIRISIPHDIQITRVGNWRLVSELKHRAGWASHWAEKYEAELTAIEVDEDGVIVSPGGQATAISWSMWESL